MGVWVWVWVATSTEWHEINTVLCVFVGSRIHTAMHACPTTPRSYQCVCIWQVIV